MVAETTVVDMESASFRSDTGASFSVFTRVPSDTTKRNKVYPAPASKGPGAWVDPRVFRAEESRRAELNRMLHEDKRIFISHCWRKTKRLGDGDDLQMKKRQMISHLSKPEAENGPGISYWADFLDLQAEGPVPWRREIEEAITMCSKVVCFVDEAWLSSFNCLQELAFAIREDKPVVVLILDQEAWELLTVPGGSRKAWTMTEWGVALSDYKEQDIVPGQKFTPETLEALFSYLGGINLCACRKLEETNFGGMPGLLDNMSKYVQKDLLYFKQHAELKEYARKWKQADMRASLLLHRAEALKWEQWIEAADTMGAMPPPTSTQRKFVKVSTSAAKSVMLRLRLAAVVLLALIISGAVASGIMASIAMQQRTKAQQSETKAIKQKQRAEDEFERAEEARRKAEEALVRAVAAEEQAIFEKLQAQQANNVSSSALISSVLSDVIDDPIMQSSELRMYHEAARLLSGAGRDEMEDELKRRIQRRFSGPVWLALEPLLKHDDRLTCAAWSTVDSNLLATGGHDGAIRIWNIKTREVTVLQAHSSSVMALVWSPVNSARLASGGHDSVVAVWDISLEGDERLLMKEQAHSGAVTALSWSSANVGKIASGGEDQSILIWTLGTQSYRVLVGHMAEVTSLMWRPGDETQLASTAMDGTARIWDLSQVSFAEILQHNISAVNAVAYSSSGEMVATGQADGMVAVWSIGEGGAPAALKYSMLRHHSQVSDITWDMSSYATPGMDMGSEHAMEMHSHNRFVSISADGVVISWHLPHGGRQEMQTQELTSVLQGEAGSPGNTFILGGMRWAGLNSTLLGQGFVVRTAGTDEVHIWRLAESLLGQLTVNAANQDTGILESTWEGKECPGTFLAASTQNGGIHVMDYGVGTIAKFSGTSTAQAVSLDWAPHECGLLLVAFFDESRNRGSLEVWQPARPELTGLTRWKTLLDGAPRISCTAWDHSNPGVIAYNDWDGTNSRIMLLDTLAPGDPAPFALKDRMQDQSSTLAWSRLDSRLAASSGLDILILDPSDSSREIVLRGHNLNVESVAWSPVDKETLISGAYDNKVIVWNVATGEIVRELLAHKGTVTSLSWSPDGRYFASASKREPDVRLWDSATWLSRVLHPGEGQDAIASLAFASHKSLLVAGDNTRGVLRFWRNVDQDVDGLARALQELHISDTTILRRDMQMYGLTEALEALV